MELESKADAFTVTLPRAGAAALADVADFGLRLVEELALVQSPASMERALVDYRRQVAAGRGRAVTVSLSRTDGSLVGKAAWTGLAGYRAKREDPPEGAAEAYADLNGAVMRAEPVAATLAYSPRRRR